MIHLLASMLFFFSSFALADFRLSLRGTMVEPLQMKDGQPNEVDRSALGYLKEIERWTESVGATEDFCRNLPRFQEMVNDKEVQVASNFSDEVSQLYGFHFSLESNGEEKFCHVRSNDRTFVDTGLVTCQSLCPARISSL